MKKITVGVCLAMLLSVLFICQTGIVSMAAPAYAADWLSELNEEELSAFWGMTKEKWNTDDLKSLYEEHREELAGFYEEHKDELTGFYEEHKDELTGFYEEHKDELAGFYEQNQDKLAESAQEVVEPVKEAVKEAVKAAAADTVANFWKDLKESVISFFKNIF